MPRCFSKCRKIKKEECGEKQKCKYIDRNTRKYCRLSTKYKKDKSCNVTRKFKKGETAAVISRFGRRITEKRRLKKKSGGEARSMIGRFMLRNPVKMRRNFLMSVCPDSGECVAVGKEMKTIRDYFEGFSDFFYLDSESPAKKIGKESGNGFVKELKYTRGGYSSYAILKSTQTSNADNLVYEYQVGQYINKMCNYFPCLLETYALYFYKDNPSWRVFQNISNISDNLELVYILKNKLEKETNIDYGKACQKSKYAAILIQHIKDATTLNDLLTSLPSLANFVNGELVLILFQIYYTLSQLSSTFTHYDLHSNNVLVYTVKNSKYIQYHYHTDEELVTSFKSKYIVKIIDYGRSFFDDKDEDINSKKILEEQLCKLKECEPGCGEKFGFKYLINDMTPDMTNAKNRLYIDSAQPNQSHDLRLLYLVGPDIKTSIRDARYEDVFKSIVYGNGIIDPNKISFGTRPLPDGFESGKIQTVNDAFYAFERLLQSGTFIADVENEYSGFTKLGDLHVYGKNNAMEYKAA
jgi:hypothetical protein